MKAFSVCFMMIYLSVFGYLAIAQVREQHLDRLKFTRFEIVRQNGKVNFNWDVTNQANCRYFEIEKSTNERDFMVVALAFPFENNQDSVYKYFERIGKRMKNQNAFFRIKALMKDASPVYSNVIQAE